MRHANFGSGLFLAASVCAVLAAASPAGAALIADANSTMTIDPLSPAGISSWTVDGVEHVAQQWLWFRIGATGPEQSVHTIGAPAVYPSDSNDDGVDDTLHLKYTALTYTIEIEYSLTGGLPDSGTSGLIETITIKNLSTTASLNMHLFQFVNFDLLADPGGDTAEILNTNTSQQWEGPLLTETNVNRSPQRAAVGPAADLLGLLTDTDADNVVNNNGPVYGDVATLLQWDKVIAPRGTFQILKTESITTVPEPATLAFLALGGGLFAAVSLRRKLGRH